jgi:hypothetical protein
MAQISHHQVVEETWEWYNRYRGDYSMNFIKPAGIIGIIITVIIFIIEAIRMIKHFFLWVIIAVVIAMLLSLVVKHLRKKIYDDDES